MWRLTYIAEPAVRLPAYTWDVDRKLCERCAHYKLIHPAMHCKVVPSGDRAISCIDVRTSGPCGKEGRLFQPISKPPATS